MVVHVAYERAALLYCGGVEVPDRPEEDAIVRMPPAPDELAHWLLQHAVEGDADSAGFLVAAEFAHGRLRAGLSVFFGQAGFDALWARAMVLVPQAVVGDESAGEDALKLRTTGWSDALNGRTVQEMRSVVVAAFTSFIGLLFTFVGAAIGARLLHQIWPELPLDAPSTSTGDVTK